MAKKNKMGLKIEGIEEILKRLEEVGGNIEKTTEKALIETHKFVTPNIESAMIPHNKTKKTIQSLIKSPKVEWQGSKATIEVGFDIDNGGLPSIFLMYGTKFKGTPRISQDKKLYGAIYGKKTRDAVTEIQSDVFFDAIAKAGGR